MTGLLLKDILNLKSNFKTLIPITVFYIFLLKLLGGNGLYRGIAAFMFANEAIASFSYDYMAKWDKYALSLPIRLNSPCGSCGTNQVCWKMLLSMHPS